jgi:lipoprotein-releasing system ATP-binding protein
MTELLSLTNVIRRFPGDTLVLDGVTLSVTAGESIAIVGPSGSGKSTLLNIMGTLDQPSSGVCLIDGIDTSTLGNREMSKLRNQQIGLIFQDHHLLSQCTALENVLIPTLATGEASPQLQKRATDLLDRVGLGNRTKHMPAQLSGGERQRVALVRAMINEPKLLLADEPTGSLDRKAADSLGDLLLELNQRDGVTLIVATHAMSLAKKMQRILKIEDGHLIAAGDNG